MGEATLVHLEDTFADILRKARRGQKIAAAALAAQTGLTATAIERLEADKEPPPDDHTVAAIAQALRLRPDALVAVARGRYYPEQPDTTRWGIIRTITTPYADFEVNAFLVAARGCSEAVLFDTGTRVEPVRRALEECGLALSLIAVTHTHGDHIAALEDLRKLFHPRIIAPQCEPVRAAELVWEGDTVQVGPLTIETRATYGHSPGGVSYVVSGFTGAPAVAAVGDALFAGSAGGATLSYRDLMSGLRSRIFTLPDDTLILPGHGPLTTVGQERQNNPFAP